MLVCYARELKEGFAAYTEDVVKIMVSHLKFYFHDGNQNRSVQSFLHLTECDLSTVNQILHGIAEIFRFKVSLLCSFKTLIIFVLTNHMWGHTQENITIMSLYLQF